MADDEDRVVGEREKFYDDHIAPELVRLSKLCAANGLPFLAVTEFNVTDNGDTENGRIASLPKSTSDGFRWIETFAQCGGNFERYCMTFVKHVVANKIPHSSLYLMKLGIDPDPARRVDTPAGTTSTEKAKGEHGE